jgi:hypothetical protein
MFKISLLSLFLTNALSHFWTPNSENNEKLEISWAFWTQFSSLTFSIPSSKTVSFFFFFNIKNN